MAIERLCADCAEDVKAVCRHAFGRFWDGKSGGGEGCAHPMDGVVAAWRKAGWTVGTVGVSISLPFPKAPRRPRHPTQEMLI